MLLFDHHTSKSNQKFHSRINLREWPDRFCHPIWPLCNAWTNELYLITWKNTFYMIERMASKVSVGSRSEEENNLIWILVGRSIVIRRKGFLGKDAKWWIMLGQAPFLTYSPILQTTCGVARYFFTGCLSTRSFIQEEIKFMNFHCTKILNFQNWFWFMFAYIYS